MFLKAPYYGGIFLLAGMCVLSVFAHVLVLLLAPGSGAAGLKFLCYF